MRTTVRAPSPMRWPRSVARRTVAWRTVARRTVAPRKVVASHGLVEAAVVARWLVARSRVEDAPCQHCSVGGAAHVRGPAPSEG